MSERPQISDERKLAYYGGAVIMGIGFLVFLSTFFVAGRAMDMPFHHDPGPSMMGRGVGGMVLIIIGAVVRGIGARGLAGSGVVLDPERARDDLKPWAQMAGGIVKDALAEVKGTGAAPTGADATRGPDSGVAAAEIVKVRCTQCRTLNDEDAHFCKACGAEL